MGRLGFVRYGVGLLVSVMMCSVYASKACAEYIQFTFTGEVTEIGGTFWDPWQDVFFGDAVTIQFLLDSNAEDQIDGSGVGRYSFLELSFDVAGNELMTSQGFIQIVDGPDSFILSFDFGNTSNGISMINGGSDMFQSDALPTDVDWTQYSIGNIGAIAALPSGTGLFEYVLTGFDAMVVPAAPTMFVFVFGYCCHRRRQ